MQKTVQSDYLLQNTKWKLSRHWQIILFGVLVIVGVWLFLLVQVNYEYELGVKNASREGSNLSLAFEDYVKQVFRNVDRGSLKVKVAVENRENLAKVLPEILVRMQEEPAIMRLSVFDEAGNVVISLPPIPGTININDRDYFQRHLKEDTKRIDVSAPMFGRLIQQNIMPITRRINKPDGSFGGVIVVSLHAEYFNNFFKQMELGHDKRIAVVGMDGIVKIIQQSANQKAGQDVSRGLLFQEVKLRPYGTLVSPSAIDGTRLINNYRTIPEYGLYVNVAIPEQSVLNELAPRKRNYYMITALTSLFVVAFCTVLIRRLQRQYEDARRMSMLQQTTSRLVTDNFEPDKLLQIVLQDAITLIGAPGGHISMIDPDGKTWTIQFAQGVLATLKGSRYSVETGLAGEVIRTGELRYLEDYHIYAGKLDHAEFEQLTSIVMIPLKKNDQTIGILSAAWVEDIHCLSAEDMSSFCQYATLAVVALESSWTRQQVQKLAYTDVLTDLPNRRAVYEYLAAELDKECGVEFCGAVLFVGIDELEVVNDTFGHSCGDYLLIEAGRRLCNSAGENAFIGRLAGDEFVVILSGESDTDAITVIAERIVLNLSGEYEMDEAVLHVSASVGIATYPLNGKTVGEILKNADAALYAAKEAGKSAWHFYDALLQQKAYETVLLMNSLHYAIERSELSLHYQPQFHSNGQIVGFEALVRWSSVEHGSVPPSTFIPLAEKGRLIRPIGEWVLYEACLFAKRLADAGQGTLRVAVNVSARQFDAGDFSEIVKKNIALTGIQPSQLEIEVTESALMESIEECGEQLKKINILGVGLLLVFVINKRQIMKPNTDNTYKCRNNNNCAYSPVKSAYFLVPKQCHDFL